MLLNINKITGSVILLSMLLTACQNKKESESKSNTSKQTETKPEEHHEEAPATIASLTAEQIKTVGIAYGTVEMKELTATIKANGNLKVPNNSKGNATSLYGGVIKSLNVQIGSYVRKGQPIATLANNEVLSLQQEYIELINSGGSANSSATYNNAQYANLNLEKQAILPQIEYAQKEMNRQQELYEGNAGARKNLELAQSNLKALREKLNVLNEQLSIYKRTTSNVSSARLSGIKIQLQNMGINPNAISANSLQSTFNVYSPISGTVSNVFAKIGSYVDVSSPVAEVVDNGSLHLDLNVFEKDLPMLKVGQVIHFTLTNNPATEYDAMVFSIGTAFENESKTIPVHCNVKGNKTGLIDGMNITGIVSLNNVTTPAVPTDAIVEADGKFYIFVITNKEPEEHHEEGEEGHDHKEAEKGKEIEPANTTNFEKIEVVKGVTNMGYTAVTFLTDIPKDAKIVVKGAFFVNAKLSNTGGHEH
jgi:membrane fusion protein, heavy metal efflux system